MVSIQSRLGNKQKRKRRYDTRQTHGLFPKNYSKPVAWKVDYDYLDKLTQAEKEWLSDFSSAHYSGDFRSAHGSTWFPHEKREAYVQKNAANRDSYSIAEVSSRIAHIPDLERSAPSGRPREFDVLAPHDTDEQHTPSYLNSETYRAALEEYRASIPARGLTAKGFTTPAERERYERARWQIKKVIRYGENPPDEDPARGD